MWGDIRQEEFNINSFTAGGGGGRSGEEEPHSLCQHFIDFVQGCSNRHLIVNQEKTHKSKFLLDLVFGSKGLNGAAL